MNQKRRNRTSSEYQYPNPNLRSASDLEDSPLRQELAHDRLYAWAVEALVDQCGGMDQLENLTTTPVPNEPFNWSGIEDVDRPIVEHILTAFDQAGMVDGRSDREPGEIDAGKPAHRLLTGEYLTIAQRLLHMAATHPSHPLRRKAGQQRIAAALGWLALMGNGRVNPRPSGPGYYMGREVWACFGVNSCVDLGTSILAGLKRGSVNLGSPWSGRWFGPVALGHLSLLSSEMRASIIETRDNYTALIRQHDKYREQAKSFRHLGDGQVEIKMRPTTFVDCYKLQDLSGRTHLMLALGEALEESEFIGLSIPDAHRLLERLQNAIDSPMPQSLN